MSKASVLIFTTSEGHISIAHAIHGYLTEQHIAAEVIFYPEPAMNFYKLLYRYNPNFFYIFYRCFYHDFFNFWLRIFLRLQHGRKIKAVLRRHHPRVVINTSFGFSPTLSHLRQQFGYYFVNVLPNPRTFFPQDLEVNADLNIVFDDHQQQLCAQLKPQAKTVALGWFVRGDFEQKMSSIDARRQAGLPSDARTVLIASGSEGIFNIADLVSGLTAKTLPPTTIVVACGSNKLLKFKIRRLAQQHNSGHLTIKALGFTDQMPLYMSAADVVVGKAGPNTLFESVATLTPFVATTYIKGQESGNLEIINDYYLGYVALEPETAVEVLTDLIIHPAKITALVPDLTKVATKNQLAKKKLLELIQPHLLDTTAVSVTENGVKNT